MPELSRITPAERARIQTVGDGQGLSALIAAVAERQWGVVTRRQLRDAGVTGSAVSRWVAAGRLHRMYPGVYAVGHRKLRDEGQLAAALLYAGPGAALSHATAGWWWGILKHRPDRIDLSAPGQRRPLPHLLIHHPRHLERVWHRGLPVTRPARTLLDLAPRMPRAMLRRAVAEAFYLRLVTVDAVEAVLTRGHPGSRALREALAAHTPQLARTRSVLEERFLALCEESGFPLPEVNVRIEGLMVDAAWRRHRVVVELDGQAAHGGPAAIESDRARELKLRAAGWLVVRYSWTQVSREPERVAADLRVSLRGAEAS